MSVSTKILLLLLCTKVLWGANLSSPREIALLDAIVNKENEIEKFLYEDVDPSKLILWQTSSLHYAAMVGISPKIFETLIKKSQNINQTNCTQMTPLYHAVKNGHKDLVQLLINYGAEIDDKTWNVVENKKDMLAILSSKNAKPQ